MNIIIITTFVNSISLLLSRSEAANTQYILELIVYELILAIKRKSALAVNRRFATVIFEHHLFHNAVDRHRAHSHCWLSHQEWIFRFSNSKLVKLENASAHARI